MSALLTTLHDQIASQLRFRCIRKCSDWSSKFRVMSQPFHGPYSTIHHPWCKEMLDWDENWVGLKASQVGFTEVALNRSFFTIDIKRQDVMYVLPKADPDASVFSASRFTPALELSPHLKNLFSDANNVGHKRAGPCNLFVRGAQSRSGLMSVPVALMIFDELDEMPKENVEIGLRRVSGQLNFQIIKVSTPTLPDVGISLAAKYSTKEIFTFKCPHCSRWISFKYPDSHILTADSLNDTSIKNSHYICTECKHKLEHETKVEYLSLNNGAHWVKTQEGDIRGFTGLSKMYAMVPSGHPVNFAKERLKAMMDKTSEQTFINSDCGLAHVVEGAKISLENINRLLKSHSCNDRKDPVGMRVMGVDVGSWLHCEISDYFFDSGNTTDLNVKARCRNVTHLKVLNFEDLDTLMKDYQIRMCVIDANPERRKAKEFAARFPNYVYMCFYGNNCKGNDLSINEEARTITVDRTSWMDMALGRFNSSRIDLPNDTKEEYKDHLQNVARMYGTDSHGNPVGNWINTNNDHYCHSRTYNEIAFPLAMAKATGRDIKSFL